ncbi:MAG: ice-binding family protein [Bacteroidales bacterium]|jgi:hypothetical protein
MKTKKLLAFLAIVSVVLFAGCKKDDFVEKVGVCPVVILTVPANNATGVPLNQVITVTFNEKMNPATITQTTFTLMGPSRVTGTLTYDGTGPTFSFTPSSLLEPNTTYTGKVTRAAKDMAGNALQADYIWTFKTAQTQYTVALSSNPALGGITTGQGTYDKDATVAVTATANAGFTFTNWTEGVNVVSTNANYSFTITGNRTLVANFTAIINYYVLTLSSNPAAGGTTSGGGSYSAGTSVTAAATANPGYVFINWTEGLIVVSSNASYTFSLTGNRTLVANFSETINTYTLTLSSNPLAGGSTSGGGSYNSGTSVTAAAVANPGYVFTSWTEGSVVVSTDPNYTFVLIGNRTLVANFTESVNTFTLSLSANPTLGGTTSGGGTYNSGTSVTASATANTGYVFNNWTEGSVVVSSNPNYTFTLISNRILVANFTESVNVYVLTLSSNPVAGGATSGGGSFNENTNVTAVAAANPGYVFTNWTEGSVVVSTDNIYAFILTGNRTLVANFTESVNSFLITLSSNPVLGGNTIGGGSFNSGTSITVRATANSGYVFTNWTEGINVVSTDANYVFTVTGNRTLVANFTEVIVTYTVTLSSNPALGGNTTGGGTYNSGASVTVGATPNSGYLFTNWTEGANVVSTDANYTFVITANRTLVANFSIIVTTYTVTLSSNPALGGNTTGGGTYNSGASVTVGATPNSGYLFTNWTEGANVVSTDANYTFVITGNRTLTANFSIIVTTYVLVVHAVNGTVAKNPDLANYNSGASVILTATPSSGYSFDFWSGDATGTVNPVTVIMNSNKDVTANFKVTPPVGPIVNLRTAADFVILTKAGISTSGVTSITGDIGVSPIAATGITGFGLIMDASNQWSHTPIVTGRVYAADYAAPTPAKLTTAVSDMETAYTEANNLVVPAPIVDLYAGDISGKTLAPGLYKWSTGLLITGAGVTLAGNPNDTWVFQIAQNLTVENSAIVTLAGGAQAKNIYWVVAGEATLGTTVNFSGNILSKTLISLNTGARVTGRLLAQTAVTLNANTVILP